MARMEVEYTIQEENEVGVENFKVWQNVRSFSFTDPPEKLQFINYMRALIAFVRNKYDVLGVTFVAKFDGIIMAEWTLYARRRR